MEGLITDCGWQARALAEKHGWFDLFTLRGPYRIEGKKTMGYELAEWWWCRPRAAPPS